MLPDTSVKETLGLQRLQICARHLPTFVDLASIVLAVFVEVSTPHAHWPQDLRRAFRLFVQPVVSARSAEISWQS